MESPLTPGVTSLLPPLTPDKYDGCQLPSLLPELLIKIIGSDPGIYRLLSLTCKRISLAVRPALSQVSQRFVLKKELLSFLQGNEDLPSDIKIIPLYQNNKILVIYTKGSMTIISPSGTEIVSTWTVSVDDQNYYFENVKDFGHLIESDMVPDLLLSYAVYQKRISCVKLDPNYAKKLVWAQFNKCFRNDLHQLYRLRRIFDITDDLIAMIQIGLFERINSLADGSDESNQRFSSMIKQEIYSLVESRVKDL